MTLTVASHNSVCHVFLTKMQSICGDNMDKFEKWPSMAVVALGFGIMAATPSAQAQGSCPLSQDDIVAAASAALSPGSGLLTASAGRIAGVARGVAAGSSGCALDVVVALGNIRPDAAGEIAQAVADVSPGERADLAAAGEQIEQSTPPAAGTRGATQTPGDDEVRGDDERAQRNDVSPA